MDILGVGFAELMVILIIAMIVFGPRRLPEMAAKAGKIVRDLRSMSQGLLLEWQREIAVASRLDDLEATRRELTELKKELNQTQREIGQQARKSAEQFQKQVKAEASKVENTVKSETEQAFAAVSSTDGNTKPASDPSTDDSTPEVAPKEKPQQASNSDSKPSPEQETTPDESPPVKTPKPVVKPKLSKAVKVNGKPDNPAPSSEQPSQSTEALNE